MSVSTFTQPDYTAQTGATYKANLDGAADVMKRLGAAFAPHAQASADMTVRLDAGAIFDGATLTEVAAQSTGTISAPSTNPRIDRVVVDRATGVASVITGTENASPAAPAITAGKVPVAQVSLVVSQSSIVNADITDERQLGVLGLKTAAFENVGTGANQVVQLDGSAKLPAVDGSQLTGVGDAVARNNILLNAFRIAINGGLSVLNMQDGIVDEFEDETGVDTGGSTNETYDATNDFYTNTGSTTTEGTFALGQSTTMDFGDADVNTLNFGFLFTNTNAGKVTSVKIDVDAVTNAFNCVAKLYTESAGSPGTQVGGNSDTVNLDTTGDKTFTWSSNAPSLSAGTEYWMVLTDTTAAGDKVSLSCATNQAGFSSGRHDTITSIVDESVSLNRELRCEIKVQASAVNMTLLANAFTAEATPAEARIVLFEEDVDAVTLNTDLRAYASRDGGTTYTQITLADEGDYATNKRILAGTVDISGQPSGTSMKWKVETLNAKELKLHGVALQWS
ncbi:MAG: hypothetical protein IIA73_04595 [Proteobacteria bacterium]|nr:hypothetical protein [Pseudomonadota bacterium]